MTLVERGRHVAADGRIVYAWPPEGRFAVLWQRIEAALPSDDEKCEAAALLDKWRSVWYDTEPNLSLIHI